MPEPPDAYCDQLHVLIGPYGCALIFSAVRPGPPMVDTPAPKLPVDQVATLRMSIEHLKAMAFLLQRNVREYQKQAGIQVPLPEKVLGDLRTTPQEWKAFWGEN